MANKKAVLIAEESLAMIQLYKGLLAPYDCVVHSVSSLKEARERMMRYDYDLYIIDTILENKESGLELVGRGGADPDKCLILSRSLPEDTVSELVEFHKVPREMIMVKPPDARAFIVIANKHLRGEASPDNIIIPTTSVSKLSDKRILYRIKRWVLGLSFKGWIAIISFMLILPTTTNTTAKYFSYKQHLKFEQEKVAYCEKEFKSFKQGDTVSKTTFRESTILDDGDMYIIRIYPDNIVFVKIIYKDRFYSKERWIVGENYLKTIGLNEKMTLLDILKSLIML
ncbi:MAG TPA: response regulator [Patescibacteria group bacterium]|nr:response regulator [Patescibacteria group bacterium]